MLRRRDEKSDKIAMTHVLGFLIINWARHEFHAMIIEKVRQLRG